MKRILQVVVFVFLLLDVSNLFSQINSSYQWTWIGGNNIANTFGSYGQKGVENPANKPGARVAAANWIDRDGTLWLFGGYGYTASGYGYLNDLWKYNLSSNQWTWVAGDSIPNGLAFHGDIGKEGIGFKPSARFATAYWVNGTGTDLYLFGGFSNGAIVSDVWSFNVYSNMWTFVKAEILDSSGNCSGQAYGTVGTFTPGVWPVCRYYSTAASAGGAAYVFGGSTGGSILSDLYLFSNVGNTTANEWAYLKFSTADAINNAPVHTLTTSKMGSRSNPMSFAGTDGKFYVFGGSGYGDNYKGYGNFNDLWVYSGTDLMSSEPIWSWINGESTVEGKGSYGTLGIADRSNNPPARNAGTIRPAGNGQYILLGGGADAGRLFNDVWNYDLSSNTWTWIGGTNVLDAAESYGQKGIQSSSNVISARGEQACWITANGDMYVFGGRTQYGWNNDMWKFSKPQDFITVDAVSGTSFYPGSRITVSYSVHPQAANPLSSSNYFYLQLSDANGSFAAPVNIGLISSNTSGTITTNIPYSSTTGTNYKVRILATGVAYASPASSQPITISPNPIVAARGAQKAVANFEYTFTDGWTNYYYDTLLLLSLRKNGNNIGYTGDGTFSVECTATAGAGFYSGVRVTNPLVTNTSGYWTMNRYWKVTPGTQPATPVGVRFYFNEADLKDIQSSVFTIGSVYDLQFYKTIGGNPDPESNWAGATSVVPILNGNAPSETSWIYQPYGSNAHRAEFTVSSFSGGGGGGTQDGLVLPVQLTSFTGTLQNQDVFLQWQTASETGASFTIQRSADGINFTSLGQTETAGRHYGYYDKTIESVATKTVYYRLQIRGKDGLVSYSQVVPVSLMQPFYLFTLSPNPASSKITISGKELSSVRIYDMTGRLLVSRYPVQSNNVSISIGHLAKGLYTVRIADTAGHTEAKKMIVE